MSPKWLTILLKYFSFWGFHCVPSVKFGGSTASSLIFVFHIVFCSWCSFVVLRAFAEQQAIMEFLDALNFFLNFITFAASYWLIIFDSYTNQTDQNKFWKIYSKIQEEYGHKFDMKKWDYFVPSIVLLIGSSSIYTLVLIRENITGVATIMMNIAFLYIFDHRLFFYLLHLKAIAFQLWKIDNQLKEMMNTNPLLNGDSERMHSIQFLHDRNQFKWIRRYYEMIYQMCESVNTIFGWSHLALVMLNFHTSVTFLSFIYRLIYGKFDAFDNSALIIFK